MSNDGNSGKKFFIIDQGGQILFFSDCIDIDLNHQDEKSILTASYLTAVINFAKATTDGKIISSFEMEKSHVFLKNGTELPVIYAFFCSKEEKYNEKKISKQISEIAKEFEERFCLLDLEEWDGSMDFFEAFGGPFSKIMKIKYSPKVK